MGIFCAQCGVSNDSGNFCFNCGSSITKNVRASRKPVRRPVIKRLKWTSEVERILMEATVSIAEAAIAAGSTVEKPVVKMSEVLNRSHDVPAELIRNRVYRKIDGFQLMDVFERIRGTQKYTLNVSLVSALKEHLATSNKNYGRQNKKARRGITIKKRGTSPVQSNEGSPRDASSSSASAPAPTVPSAPTAPLNAPIDFTRPPPAMSPPVALAAACNNPMLSAMPPQAVPSSWPVGMPIAPYDMYGRPMYPPTTVMQPMYTHSMYSNKPAVSNPSTRYT